MTGIKRASVALFSACMVLSGFQTVSAIEKPAVLPDAVLSVTISDFHGFVDGAGLIAAKANPQINGMMLKLLLGMQIGDPGLAGIAPGKGLSVIATDATNVFAVLEVSEPQVPVYSNLATARGMQSSYTNGVLIIGPTVELVDQGIKRSEDVKKVLLAERSPALRIGTRPATVLEKNNDLVQGYMKTLPSMMETAMMMDPNADTNSAISTAKILEGELSVLLSLTKQCETLEISLSPAGGALQLSETFVPVAGSDLAKLVNAPKTVTTNKTVQAGVLGDGMLMIDMVFGNAGALAEFLGAEIDKMAKVMDLKDVDVKAIVDLSEKWAGTYSGAACEMFSMDPEGGIENGVLMETADAQLMLEMYRSFSVDMVPLMSFYEEAGMPMTFEFKEKVREYQGIPIHQFNVLLDVQNMPAEQQEQMNKMKLNDIRYELAFFDGLVLYYAGEQKIETLIDRVKDKEISVDPLKARSVYPEGGFYYVDFNTAQYLELISAFIPAEQQSPMMPQLIALMQGADPVTAAGFRENGCVKCSVNFPGDLLAKLGQIGMMMQTQQPQPGAPAGIPVQ